MNCPQCQAANAPDAGFCGNCGARLSSPAPADQSGYQSSPGYTPSGSGSSIGQEPPTVYNAPAYKAPPPPSAYNSPPAPSYDAQPGYNAQPGYGGPSGGGQAPSGYGQDNYGQGGYGQAGGPAPGGQAPGGYPPPGAQQPGGYPPAGGQAPGGYPPQNQYQPGTQGGFRQRSSSGGIQPVNFNMARLVLTDRIVGVATLITLIALFLPWFSAKATFAGVTDSATISGVSDHGWLWLEFIVALIIIAYVIAVAAWDQLPFTMPVAHIQALIGATVLQFLLVVIGFIAKPAGDSEVSVGWSFGSILALIAALVALAAALPQVTAWIASRRGGGQAGPPPRQY